MKIDLFFWICLADVAWEHAMTIPFIQRELCSSITVHFQRIYGFFLIFITELICMRTGPLFRGDSLDPDVCHNFICGIALACGKTVLVTKRGLSLLQGMNSSHTEIPVKQWPWFPANSSSNREFCLMGERKESTAKSWCRESRAEQKPLCCLVGPGTHSAFPEFLIPSSSCPGKFPDPAPELWTLLLVAPVQCPAQPFCFPSRCGQIFMFQSHSCCSRSGVSSLFQRNWCMECSVRRSGKLVLKWMSFEGSLPAASGVPPPGPFIIPCIPCRHLQECRIRELLSLSLRYSLVLLVQTFFSLIKQTNSPGILAGSQNSLHIHVVLYNRNLFLHGFFSGFFETQDLRKKVRSWILQWFQPILFFNAATFQN